MKKIIFILLFILPLTASAYDFKVNGICYNILSQEERTVEVTYKGSAFWVNEYDGDIYIPEEVTYNELKYHVISIGEYAFYGCNISSITLPNQITAIRRFAFYGNSSLIEITLPSNLERIEESAFDRTGLTSLSFPPSLKHIESAFYQTSISTIYVSDIEAWLTIEYEKCSANGAFFGRYDLYVNNEVLQNVTIPEGISEIKDFAFCCCKSIISVNLPNTIEKIGRNAFYGCGGLGYVNLPNNIKSIGAYAFCGNSGLSFSSIPESVLEIGEYAFQGTYITSMVWPSKVETIPEECFASCPLTNITIPNTVKTIGVSAFLGCDFSEINLPESIETIERHAFDFCENLKSIEVPSSVKTIGSNVFTRCHSLVSVKLNEGLESIGDNAFNECSKLIEINIPSTISEIQDNTFNGCFRLPSIILPNSIKKIGLSAFKGCSGMTQITSLAIEPPFIYGNSFEKFDIPVYVPKGKKEIYQQANGWNQFTNIIELVNKYKLLYFINKELYKEIEIAEGANITPEAEPTKEGYTFSGWNEIPETMPAHDVTVTGTFIINKYKLTYTVDGTEYKTYEVEYGATITPEAEPTKEGYTFSGWSEIPQTMPAHDVTVTGTFTQVIYDIDDVTYEITGEGTVTVKGGEQKGEVTIEATIVINGQTYRVTAIADNAFKDNKDITSLTIPEGITTIGDNAFDGCIGLILINIGKDIKSIGNKAFANVGTVSGARTRSAESSIVVNCYAENVPQTALDAFENTPIETASLFVDDNSVNAYKTTSPWSGFGKIMGFDEAAGIYSITIGTTNAHIYDMQGNRLDNVRKGVNIIRMKDGKTKKVMVK